MRKGTPVVTAGLCAAFVAAMPYLSAQERSRDDMMGSPLARPAVLDAPFIADATTLVKQTLRDGTRVDQTVTARYYRDSAGRVRVEQIVPSANGRAMFILIAPDPTSRSVYTLEPSTRTYYSSSRDIAALVFNGRTGFALPMAPNRFLLFRPEDWRTAGFDHPVTYSVTGLELLGSRLVAGVRSMGRRTTMTIAAGENSNAEPIDIIGEQWESSELGTLLYSRYSNPETGLFEYRLTNISRVEPQPELFVVPTDYVQRNTTADDPAMTLEFWPRTPAPNWGRRTAAVN
jgi:hypothetical protein